MARRNGFEVLDRRTMVADDLDGGEPADHAGASSLAGDKPNYVQLLEERTLRAEEQVTRYARRFNEELDKQLAQTRERLSREAQRELAGMRGDLVSELLEVLDNFDRSLAALAPDANDGVRQGLTLVREQFFGTLSRQGLCEVDALGEIFDPTVHEATSIIPVTDPAQDKQVIAVVKPGYRLASTLVRPALVQVGRLT